MSDNDATSSKHEPSFRIRLLGPLRIFGPDGEDLGELGPSIESRVLLALALRAGMACPRADLIQAGWGWDSDKAYLPAPLARLRKGWKLAEITKAKRGMTAHALDLPRGAIDALSFIDITSNPSPPLDAFNEHLALWTGDPRSLDAATPDWVWSDLTAAVDRAVAFVAVLADHERARLTNLPGFLRVVGRRDPSPTPVSKRGRLLIVEDNPLMVDTLKGVLHDFECVVAANPADAMSHILDENLDFSGAIVDRHLSSSLDSAGLTVLGCLRDTPSRSHVPRVLLTSDTPEGPDLEIRKAYGLFAIVTKGGGGAAAPGIREVVETMVADPRARAVARLEGEATALGHSLGRLTSTARRSIRQEGGDAVKEARLLELQALQDEFHEDQERLELSLPSLADTALSENIDEFLVKWRGHVDGSAE